MQETIDIKEIFYLCLKRWKWIVGCATAGFLLLFVLSSFVIPKKYTSSVHLLVNSKITQENGGTDINTINASQKLVNTYIAILQNDDILQQVCDKLSKETEPEELLGMLSMRSVNQTEVLEISATSTDPVFSAEICNTIAEVAPGELQRVMKAGSIEKVEKNTIQPNYEKSSPSVSKYSLVGLFIGLLIALGVVLIQYFTDNTVKSEEDLKQKIDVPVLGEVPSFDYTSKGGRRHA